MSCDSRNRRASRGNAGVHRRVWRVRRAERGEFAAARALHERALEGRQRVLGDQHPETLNSLANLENVPEAIRAQIPRRYREQPHSPTEGLGLPDDDLSLAPLSLEELLTRRGDLTPRERRLLAPPAIAAIRASP